jgi:DNA-directed RNA polymerase specialized sigma24 family protein
LDGHGFTPGEAARLIGSSGVAARVQLHRARRALRGEIEGLLGAPGRRLGGG